MNDPMPSPAVLLVDDDPTTRFFLRNALDSVGLRILEADRGDRGVALFNEHRPRLAIVDYRMAGMDGIECCRRLRENAEGGPLTIFMLTGRDDADLPDRARAAGADRFFHKPIHWLGLACTARDALRTGAPGSPA